MPLNRTRTRAYLRDGDLRSLFFEELGWDAADIAPLRVTVDNNTYTLTPVAHKRHFYVFRLTLPTVPPSTLRRKIESQVTKRYREHFIIFTDQANSHQVWQWVRRDPGRSAGRSHEYRPNDHSGEALIQKLERLAFSLEEEEGLGFVDVVGSVRAAFNVERATKRFYDSFKKERDAFQKLLEGIPSDDLERWYVSVMLNRIMFLYFIQRKGFLDGDTDYLRTKLTAMQRTGKDRYYREFLCPLFFAGLAEPTAQRTPAMRALLGDIPYLNGGIFEQHEVEQLHGQTIRIADRAFVRLFDFFDQYQWHLDDRPLQNDNEINPDVLGYIFEKYINQKQMGAYYTKEDITEYISKNTIIPFLFDAAQKEYPAGFRGENAVWTLLSDDPDRYIYEAVRKGTELALPAEIAVGVDDVSQRGNWNTPTPDAYALPTEIWRETVARRQRYEEVRLTLAAGDVRSINDLITYNLDIRQFAQDVVESTDDPELLRAFWREVRDVTVLDPTCGSGAFLFAALNILEPLYEACLDRMAYFVESLPPDAHPEKLRDFKAVLDDIARHPNRTYFIYKSVIVNNLYGVDIMHEAVEIAKLRLFLKLASQVEIDRGKPNLGIEPLPDIDFNIRAGNTLVGFATRDDVDRALRSGTPQQDKLLILPEEADALARIEEKAGDVDRLYQKFRALQTSHDLAAHDDDYAATKAAVRRRLEELADELNRLLALQYGVGPEKPAAYQAWLASHEPFHWFVEFFGIMSGGGFDVVIGNPPYVRYTDVKQYELRGFRTLECGDLYAFTLERSYSLLNRNGSYVGMIVPISLFGVDGFRTIQDLTLKETQYTWLAHFANRPSQLFRGAQKRLTIIVANKSVLNRNEKLYCTSYLRWISTERDSLFHNKVTYALNSKPFRIFKTSLEKLGNRLELSAFEKFTDKNQHLEKSIASFASHEVYYTRAFGYFLGFLDRIPSMVDVKTGAKRQPSELKTLAFNSREMSLVAIAILSSSTFFWYWNVLSDCRNLNRRDILSFPLRIEDMDERIRGDLAQAASEYLYTLYSTAETMLKNGMKIETFGFSKQKHLIDDIDRNLSRAFGFTAEELDFIINYDIKYRMGDELFNDEDE